MAFDYRQFLAENKLTKVSKGQETGKAKILSEGIQILEEGEQWAGKFTTDNYNALVQAVQNAQGKCSFNLNGKDFTVRPKGERYLVTSGVNDFGYEAMDIEGACKAAYQYSTGHLKEGKCPECGQDPCVCECGDLDMMEANKQKEDYLKRKEREAEGNWKGSVGAFVETHGEELGMAATSRQSLVDYIENVMKPELNDEAKGYVDNLVATVKSPYKLLMSLYNATLKGSGLGLNEQEDEMLDEKMESLDLTPVKDTLRMLRNHFKEAGHLGHGMVSIEFREGEPVEVYHNGNMIGQIDLEESESLMEMAQNHASLGGERTRKRAGLKPGSANQDKMAKSEMTGERVDVTLNGITKSISKQAWTRYRKMTDPEEKKAWKKRHGFIQ